MGLLTCNLFFQSCETIPLFFFLKAYDISQSKCVHVIHAYFNQLQLILFIYFNFPEVFILCIFVVLTLPDEHQVVKPI